MNATLAQGVEAHTQPSEALLSAAVLQMVSAPDLDHNLKRAEALIHEAAAGGAQLISLPEYFCLLGRRDTDKVAIRESWGKGPMQQFLSEMAQRHQI
ncbi:MAG: carbon-nitrogen hydrolase family protein, partial [Betaproteobacteria bacterium]|nr:carbon-nitrogen hydrolase family protein [Betaproteobacteria bacterium]